MKPHLTTGSTRRTTALGVVAMTLAVGAGGIAYALAGAERPAGGITAGDAPPSVDQTPSATADRTAHPVSGGADVVRAGADAVQAGADEYTQERSDAFWGAGYYMEDAFALAELWDVEVLEAKGRAGQLLLDGQTVPVAPGSALDLTDPSTIAMFQLEAYGEAGYTGEDGVALAELWDVDVREAKTTAGQMLLDGLPLPVAPSGTPAS